MIRGNKKILIVSLVLASTMLFSALTALIINSIYKKNSLNNPIEVSSIITEDDCDYVFSAYGCWVGNSAIEAAPTEGEYYSCTTFGIKNAYGLIAFAHSVSNGYVFGNKNVYLLGDIDGNQITNHEGLGNFVPIGGVTMWDGSSPTKELDSSIYEFVGTFDGQNYTVSNLLTTVNDSPWRTHFGVGFFGTLGPNAKVYNLRIKNYKINLTEDDGYAWTGAIAGYVKSDYYKIEIKNCFVDGFNVKSVITGSYHAGFVGWADCGVDATNSTPAYFENIHLKDFTEDTTDSRVYSICCSTVYDLKNYVIQNSAGKLNTNNAYANYNAWNGSVFESDNSILGTNSGTAGKVWYQNDSYNDGYPYLRQFIKWGSLGFSLYGDDTIEQYITVPTDGITDAHKAISSQLSNLTITVFGQSATAGLTDPYDFNGWERITNTNNYRAKFSKKTFEISFVGHSQTTNTSTNLAYDTAYYIYYGETISISTTSYSQSGCYSSITYSFTDTGGTTRSITYYPVSGCYLSNTTVNNLTGIVVTSKTIGLSVTTASKSYTPSFG